MSLDSLLLELNECGIKLALNEENQIKVVGKKENLTPQLVGKIRDCKSQLVDWLKKVSETSPVAILPVARISPEMPLSFAQRRLWMVDKMQGSSAEYNMPMVFEVDGICHPELVEQALNLIVARHEILRTVYVERQGQAVQLINSAQPQALKLTQYDLSDCGSEQVQQAQLSRLLQQQGEKAFDLSSDLMIRACFIKLAQNQGVLLVCMHHIACDGWSQAVFTNEFGYLYNALAGKETPQIAPLAIQYADFAHWQNHHVDDNKFAQQLEYWQQALSDLPELHSLNLPLSRPSKKQNNGALLHSELPNTLAASLMAQARQQQMTPFMLIHGALGLILSKYSNSHDVVIGTPISGRLQPEIEPLIGFFVNTLVLRATTNYDTFGEYIAHIKEVNTAAHANQDVPFEQLVEALGHHRSEAYTPLFQIMLTVNTDTSSRPGGSSATLAGMTLTPARPAAVKVKFDLEVEVTLNEHGLDIGWRYDTALFDAAFIARLDTHFSAALNAIALAPTLESEPLASFNILSQQEQQNQLYTLNETQRDIGAERRLHEYFESQVDACAQDIAVLHGQTTLTYSQLNARANQLAHYLKECHGVGANQIVGIHLTRSIDMVVAVLAVLKAGGAYLPLDPEQPTERLNDIIIDSDIALLLTHTELSSLILNGEKTLCINRLELSHYQSNNPTASCTIDDTAYVIYTSGSTGKPKGVRVAHRSLANYLYQVNDYFHGDISHSVLATSLSFDATVTSLFGGWLAGGYLALAEGKEQLFNYLEAAMNTTEAGLFKLTPTHIQNLNFSHISDTAHIIVLGGEALSKELADKLLRYFPAASIINEYGPTEATVGCSYETVTRENIEEAEHDAYIHIGRPIVNTQLLVLDEAQKLTPYGAIGELYIGGSCLSQGYLNRPELNAQKFIQNPYFDKQQSNSSELLYRTGDLVYYRPDGNLQYVGRNDEQVKIRGLRVELGEIEQAIVHHDDIDSVSVQVKDEALIAYFKPKKDIPSDELSAFKDRLKAALITRLPQYMIPQLWVQVMQWPLTKNGKLDTQRLPEPDWSILTLDYVAPNSEIEHKLVQIWAELLKLEPQKVSTQANFFELGGHSVLLIQLLQRACDELGLELSFSQFLAAPNVVGMANASASTTLMKLAKRDEVAIRYPLSLSQYRFWFIEQLRPGTNEHNMPMAVDIKGAFDLACLKSALKQMIAQHELLRMHVEVVNDEPYMRIAQHGELDCRYIDLTTEQLSEQEQKALRHLHDTKAFNLEMAPLFRVLVIKRQSDVHHIHLNMHHIISDGWSQGIFISQFLSIYTELMQGQNSVQPPLALQYADFAASQHRWIESDGYVEQCDFWKDYLKGTHEEIRLPRLLDSDVPHGPVEIMLPRRLRDNLQAYAAAKGASLTYLLQAVFALTITRLTGHNDITVGMPVSGRHVSGTQSMLGVFLNVLPVRYKVSENETFEHFFALQIENLNSVLSHQDLPVEHILQLVSNERTSQEGSLFHYVFNMLSMPEQQYNNSTELGFEAQYAQVSEVDTKFPINIYAEDLTSTVRIACHYLAKDYNYATVRALLDCYLHLLEQVTQRADLDCHRLSLGSAPSHRLDDVDHWQGSVWQRFCQQAEQHPQNIAVSTPTQNITYHALQNQIEYFAVVLAEAGVQTQSRVAIMATRSLNTVIAMFAVHKLGAIYSNIDYQVAAEKKSELLSSIDVDLVIVTSEQGNQEQTGHPTVVMPACFSSDELTVFGKLPDANVSAEQAACITFTSGSTGLSKAVVGKHAGLSNYLSWLPEKYGFKVGMNVSMLSGLMADPLQRDIYGALCCGAHLHIPPEHILQSGQVSQWFIDQAIEVSHVTPSMLSLILGEARKVAALKHVFITGEPLQTSLVDKARELLPTSILYNCYGTTESQRALTYYQVNAAEQSGVIIPIQVHSPDCVLEIRNAADQLCVQGEVGELCIVSENLSLGYLDSLAQHPSFVMHPVKGRVYKTGDLAYYLNDHSISYIGRNDAQLNLNGHRLEPAEVEHYLQQMADVKLAVVKLAVLHGQPQLVAFIESDSPLSQQAWEQSCNEHLSRYLTHYAIPRVYVIAPKLPRLSGGKLDKQALVVPDHSAASQSRQCTPQEAQLAAIWADLLDIDRAEITPHTHFFEIGGHSLLSIRLLNEVRVQCGAEITVKDVFLNARLSEMTQCIAQQAADSERAAIVPVTQQMQTLPLSFAQQRLWFIDKLQGHSTEYHMPQVFDVEGSLDLHVLTQTFKTLIARHEVLRTVYIEDAGQAWQRILSCEEINFSIMQYDISSLKNSAQNEEAKRLIAADIARAFDLSCDLPIRVSYLHVGPNSGILLLNLHHIASDGWSSALLSQECFALYGASMSGRDNPLKPLSLQYGDYAHWQRAYLEKEALDSQLDYWQSQLQDVPSEHGLLLDLPRPKRKQHQGADVEASLPASVAKQLLAVAERHQITPFMLLHGVLALVLSRHSNSSDIVIGTPVANRMQAELESLIGCFVNTLVLRVDTEQCSLSDYFAHIKEVHLDAQSNQDIPFEQLVDKLDVPRELSTTPLFQIMLTTSTDYGVKQGEVSPILNAEHVRVRQRNADFLQSKFDISINMSISEQGVGLHWIYDVSLFTHTHIQQINAHLCHILQSIAHDIDDHIPLHCIAMLSDQEISQLVFDNNMTSISYDKTRCVHSMFEQHAMQNPAQTALVFEDQVMSYGELNSKANQLAHYLRAQHGVTKDTLVGLFVERSFEMVIGILGIMKAGGAYVPVDPSYPQDRIHYMLDDANLSVLLTNIVTAQVLSDYQGELLDITGFATSADDHVATQYAANNPEVPGLCANNLAYVIYTSGSTGKPKGVMIEHQALHNRINWMNSAYGLTEQDKILQKTPYSFDVSVWEFMWTLAYGAQLVIAKPEGHKDPEYLCELIQAHGITKLHFVPSMLGSILNFPAFSNCCSIEQVFCSGEALQVHHVEGFNDSLPNAQLHNLYGPTEAAIDVSFWDCSSGTSRGTVPIGKPIDNIQLLILDAHLNVVAQGAQGELHIGGDGLARGYLNRPELTRERFIDNPYFDETKGNSGRYLYKTGDLVRLLPDGNIEFLGRIDHQVKVRGYRIELGEVEAQINQLEGVVSSLVMLKDIAGSEQLVAYVQCNGVDVMNDTAVSANIRNDLAQFLPDYMIPVYIKSIDSWPVTANGKVDRKALLALDTHVKSQFSEPRNELETQLCQLWSEVLSRPKVGIDDNFFSLGGNSILAIRLMHETFKNIGIKAPLSLIYSRPTIRELVDEGDFKPNTVELSEAILPSSIQPLSAHVCEQGDILVTGASGFVGRHLLYQLLQTEQRTIHCLMRGDCPVSAFERLQATMHEEGLWQADFALRVKVVVGNVEETDFGLDKSSYRALCEKVDLIYHCATFMDHLASYQKMRKSNVEGCINVVRFASEESAKRIIYLSTTGVFNIDGDRVVDESTSIESEVHTENKGYRATKWVAEKLMLDARARGFDLSIVRLGLTSASTQHGCGDKKQWLTKLFETIQNVGCCFSDERFETAILPVDFVAKSLCCIANSTDIEPVYHLANDTALSFSQLVELLNDAGKLDIEMVPYSEFINRLRQVKALGEEITAEYLFAEDLVGDLEITKEVPVERLQLSSQKTFEFLSRQGVARPRIDAETLHNYIHNKK